MNYYTFSPLKQPPEESVPTPCPQCGKVFASYKQMRVHHFQAHTRTRATQKKVKNVKKIQNNLSISSCFVYNYLLIAFCFANFSSLPFCQYRSHRAHAQPFRTSNRFQSWDQLFLILILTPTLVRFVRKCSPPSESLSFTLERFIAKKQPRNVHIHNVLFDVAQSQIFARTLPLHIRKQHCPKNLNVCAILSL